MNLSGHNSNATALERKQSRSDSVSGDLSNNHIGSAKVTTEKKSMETAVESNSAPAAGSNVSNGEVNGELERTDSVEETPTPKVKRQTYKYSDPPILFTDVDVSYILLISSSVLITECLTMIRSWRSPHAFLYEDAHISCQSSYTKLVGQRIINL